MNCIHFDKRQDEFWDKQPSVCSLYGFGSLIVTLTKAFLTSIPCSTFRGVATLSPRVMSVRVVRHTITSLGSTFETKSETKSETKKELN